MMGQNQIFKQLLDEGIRSTAAKQGTSLKAVELSLAAETGYSRATVQHWRRGNLPAEPDIITVILQYCVQKGNLDQRWANRVLRHSKHPHAEQVLADLFGKPTQTASRLFICYARHQALDQSVALSLAQTLSTTHTVFFDQAAHLHEWVEKTQQALAECDTFLLLLSDASVMDEVVLTETNFIWQLARQTHPQIFCVLLDKQRQFAEPFHTYLEEARFFTWQSQADTQSVLAQIQQTLQSANDTVDSEQVVAKTDPLPPVDTPPSPIARPFSGEMPEGTIDTESTLYIPRREDKIGLDAISNNGVTITIKGSRQMGKSSLLIRLIDAAQKQGKQIVFLDFQLLQSAYAHADIFFRQFCQILSYHLGLPDRTESYWQIPLTNAFRCTNYVQKEILQHIQKPILLAMDEVDSIFDTEFRTDFFGMLRSWHNSRAINNQWKKLDLALVTSTEPYYFVQNLSQSPFNVGEIIDLPPFTLEEVALLNQRHQSPLSPKDVDKLMGLLNGHPYLVRRALYLVTTQRISVPDLFDKALDDQGAFADHLRSLILRLHHHEALLVGLQQALKTGKCDDELFFRLRGIGLIQRQKGQIVPRCQLYADFFQRQFAHA